MCKMIAEAVKKHNRKSVRTGNLISPTNAIRTVLEQEVRNDVLAPDFGRKKSFSILSWFLEMLGVFPL